MYYAAKKALAGLVKEKLDMSKQCALAALKANHIPGCNKGILTSRAREVILSLYSTFMTLRLECCIQLWILSTGKMWTCWSKPRGEPQK